MSTLVEFDVRGVDLLSRLLGQTERRLEDPRPGFREIADYLRGVERQQFATQGGRSGGWRPLSASTVRQKGNSRILVASGALMRSLTGAKGTVTKRELVFGTRLFYGRFVNKERPLIDLNVRDATQIAQILGSYVVHE
jgi:hypothetical protein